MGKFFGTRKLKKGVLVMLAIKMVLAFCDKKLAKNFENVSYFFKLFKKSGRINVILQLKEVVQQCNYFYLAVDRNTDINNINQLLIFICTVELFAKNCSK